MIGRLGDSRGLAHVVHGQLAVHSRIYMVQVVDCTAAAAELVWGSAAEIW